MFENLFSPIRIGNAEIKNRGVMPPMVTDYCNTDGSVSDTFIAYHEARAKGGVGLIIVEAVYVDEIGKGFPNQLGIDSDELIPGLKKLSSRIKRHGTKIAIQLYHGGRQANTMVTGKPLVAPSAIPCPVMQAVPEELSIDEIKTLVQKFADSAERAKKAGFDIIEIHGAHGYLISQFLSPNSNHREDEYGGSFENRMRFPLEVVDAVRDRVGEDFPIIYRISSEEFLADGLMLEDAVAFSKILVEHGIDGIHVSGATYAAANKVFGMPDDILGVYVENAAAIKEGINNAVPVIVANRIKTPQFAENIIADGNADMVATGRPLICDADFYNKAKEGKEDEIRTCLSCNHCVSQLMYGHPISCIYNPLTGHELDYDLSIPAEEKRKVLVIGGGPAGMEAANIAAIRGHDVILFEQREYLGGNVVPGTVPPYKAEMLPCIEYPASLLEQNKVDVRLNTKADMDTIKKENPDNVILASGSSPIIPEISGADDDYILVAEDVLLENKTVGNRVVIVGGGSIGIETAELLNEQGKEIIVIEMTDEILSDLSPTLGGGLMARVSESPIDIITGQKVMEIKDHKVITDKQTFDNIDNVILAVGYKSNNELITELEKSDIDYKVVGDASSPRKIYEAFKEGFEASYSL